jgi:hypothetical protein
MNPYQPPGNYGAPTAAVATATRGPFLLAAIGAWLAGAYWAAITLLLMLGVAAGSVSGAQIILPVVLIVLYALRGYQLFNGDPAAARRILWLHVVGGIAATLQMMSGNVILVALNGVKILIHIFGGVTAWMAQRAYARGSPG